MHLLVPLLAFCCLASAFRPLPEPDTRPLLVLLPFSLFISPRFSLYFCLCSSTSVSACHSASACASAIQFLLQTAPPNLCSLTLQPLLVCPLLHPALCAASVLLRPYLCLRQLYFPAYPPFISTAYVGHVLNPREPLHSLLRTSL